MKSEILKPKSEGNPKSEIRTRVSGGTGAMAKRWQVKNGKAWRRTLRGCRAALIPEHRQTRAIWWDGAFLTPRRQGAKTQRGSSGVGSGHHSVTGNQRLQDPSFPCVFASWRLGVERLLNGYALAAVWKERCPTATARELPPQSLPIFHLPSFCHRIGAGTAPVSDFGLRISFGFRISIFGFHPHSTLYDQPRLLH